MSIIGLIVAIALVFLVGYLLWLAAGYIGDARIQKGARLVLLLLGAAVIAAMFFGEIPVPNWGL